MLGKSHQLKGKRLKSLLQTPAEPAGVWVEEFGEAYTIRLILELEDSSRYELSEYLLEPLSTPIEGLIPAELIQNEYSLSYLEGQRIAKVTDDDDGVSIHFENGLQLSCPGEPGGNFPWINDGNDLMSTPYTTPQTSAEVPSLTGDPRRKFWLKVVWASLAGVFIPPLLGLGITILSMRSAFKKLSESGTSDPTSLASDISNSLDSMIIGGALSTLALLLLVVALFRLRSFPKAAKNTAS